METEPSISTVGRNMTDQAVTRSPSTSRQRQPPAEAGGTVPRCDSAAGADLTRDPVLLEQVPSPKPPSHTVASAQSAVLPPQAKGAPRRKERQNQAAEADSANNVPGTAIDITCGRKATVQPATRSDSSSPALATVPLESPPGDLVSGRPQMDVLSLQDTLGRLQGQQSLPPASVPNYGDGLHRGVNETVSVAATFSAVSPAAKGEPCERSSRFTALAASSSGSIASHDVTDETESRRRSLESGNGLAKAPRRASAVSTGGEIACSGAARGGPEEAALWESRRSAPRAPVCELADRGFTHSVNEAGSGAAEPACVPEAAVGSLNPPRTELADFHTRDTGAGSTEFPSISDPSKNAQVSTHHGGKVAQQPLLGKKEAAQESSLALSENSKCAEINPQLDTGQGSLEGQDRVIPAQREDSGEGYETVQAMGRRQSGPTSGTFACSTFLPVDQRPSSAAHGTKFPEHAALSAQSKTSSPGTVLCIDRPGRVLGFSRSLDLDVLSYANEPQLSCQVAAERASSFVMPGEPLHVEGSSRTRACWGVPATRQTHRASATVSEGATFEGCRSTETRNGEACSAVSEGKSGLPGDGVEPKAGETEEDTKETSRAAHDKHCHRKGDGGVGARRAGQTFEETAEDTQVGNIGVSISQSAAMQSATLLRSDTRSSAHGYGGTMKRRGTEKGGRAFSGYVSEMRNHHPLRNTRQTPNGTHVGGRELRGTSRDPSVPPPAHIGAPDKSAKDLRHQPPLTEGLSDVSDGTDLDNDGEADAARLALLSSRERIPVGRVAALKMKLERRLERRKQRRAAMQALLEQQEAAAAAAAAEAAKNASPPPVIVRYMTQDEGAASSSERSSAEGDPLDFYFDEVKSQQSSGCDIQHDDHKLEQHLEPSASPVPAVVRGPGDLQLTSISREPTGGCIGEEATGHEGAGQTQRTNVAPLIAYTLAQAGKMVSLESGNAVGSSASPDTGLIQHPDSHFTSPDGTRVTPEAALPTSSGNALRKTFSRTEESLSARGSPPGRVGGAQLQKQSEGSSSSPDPSAYGRDTVGCGRAPVGLAEEGCSAKTASAAHSDPSVALAVLMQGHQAAISSASLRDYFLADFAPKVYGRRAVRTCMSSSAVVAKKPERANVSTPASQPHVLKERGRDLSGPRRVASGCAAFQCLAGGQNATDVGSGPHDKRRSLTSELPASSYPIHHSSAMPLSHAPLSTYNLKDVFLYLRNSVMTSTVPPVSATAGGKGSFRRSRSLFQRPCKGSEQVGTASLGRGSNSCSSGPPLRRHYTDVVGGGKTKCERSRSLRFEESSAELGGQDAIPVMKKDDTTTPSVGILTTSRQASGRNEEGCSSRAPVRNDGKTGDDGGVVSESAGFQKPVEYRAIVKVATKTLAVSENARLQRVCCDRRSSTSGDCQPDSSSVAAPDRPEAAPLFTSTEKKNGPADVAVDSRFSSSATQGEKQVAGEGPRNISTETRKTYKGEEKVPAATSINRPVCVPRLDLTPVSEARNALNPPLKKAYQRPSMDTPCISGFSTDRTSCRSYLQKKERDSEEALGVSPGGRLSRAEARREAREVGGVAYLEQANAGRDIGVRKLVSESKNKEVTDSLEKNPRPECPNPGRTGILVAAAGLPPIPGGRAAGGVLPRIPISSRVVRCNPSLFTARVCTLLAKQLEQEEQCRGDASHRGSRSKTAAKRDSGLEAARSYSSGKTGDPGRWSGAPGKDLLSSASSSKSSSVSRASSSVASVLARSPLQLIEADEGGPQRNRSSASSLRTNSSSQTRSRGSDSGSSGPPHQTNVSTSGSLNHFVVRSGFLDIEPSASLLAHLPVKSAPLNDSVSSPRNADVRSQEENKGTASSCHRDTQLIDTQFWALDMPDGGPRGYCPFEHGNHTRPGSSECSPAATAADLQGQQPALHPSDDGLPLKSARTKSKTRAHGRRVRECGVDAEVTEMAWDVWSAAGPDALGPDGTLLTSDPDILLDARESLQAALFLKPASTTSLSLVDSPSSPQQLRSEATVGHALNLKGSSIKALGSIDLESASDGNRIGIPCQVNSKLRGETICRQKREKSTKHARKELGRSRGRGIGGVPEGSAEDTEGLAFPTDEDSMETEHEITDGFDRRATSRRLRRSGGNATESEAPMRGRAQDRAKSMTEQYALLERRRDNKANNELVDNRGVDDQGSVNNASSPSERARHGQLGGSGQFCEARTRASGSQLASSPVCSADLLDRTSSQDTANNERDMRTAVGAAPQKRRTKRACSPQASSPDNKGKASIIGHSGTENSAREKYRQTSGEGLECNGISTRISSGTTSSTQSRNDSSGFVQNRTSSRHSGSSGPHSSRGGCIGAPRRSVAQPVDWSRVHRGNPAADAKKLSKAESFAYFESDTSTLATRSTTHPVTHSNSTTSTSSTGVHQRANVAAVNATECKGEQWAELENERSVVQRQHHFLGGSAPGGRDGGEYSAGMTSCAACGAGSADACICNSALFDDLGREGGGVFRSRKRHPEGSGGRRLPVQDNSLAGIPSAPVLVVDSNRQSTIAGKEQRNLSSHFIDSSRVCAAPPPTGGRIARSPIRGVIDVDYRSRAPRGRDRSVGTLSIHQTAYDREGFGGGASPRGRRRADSAESFLSRGTTKNTARLRDVVPEATGDHFVQCSRGDDIPTTVAEENRAHGAGLRGDTGERGRKAVHRRDSPSVPAEIRDPSLTADQKLKRSSEGDCGKEGAPHKGRRVLQARWREVQRNAGGPEEGSPNTRVSDGSGAAHYDCLARDTPRRCCKPSARHPMAGKEDAKLTSNALEEAHPFFYRQPRTGAALPTYPSTVSQPQGSRLPRQQQRSGAADFFGPAADDRGRPDGQVAPQASSFNMREIGQNFLTGIHSFLGGAGLGRNERK